MINLRDLIYGTQEETSTQEQTQEEDIQLPPLKTFGPTSKKKPVIWRPQQIMHKTGRQKREQLPGDYIDGPELQAENKKIPHFLTEHPSYFRFPQEEKKIPVLRRETLRNLWDQACYGGDFASAMKILRVMTEKSSVEFSDFVKFVTLLREQPDISTAQLKTLANTAIQSKLPPSNRKQTALALLDMFIQLLVAEGEASEAYSLLNQFINHPVMAQEASLSAALAVLSCLEVTRFVHQCKPAINLFLAEHLDGTTAYNKQVSDSSDSGDSEVESDGDSDQGFQSRRGDFQELERSRVTSALLCPSCDAILANPYQFYSAIDLLQQFSKIRTSKKINRMSGPDMRRMLLRCCNNLLTATENMDNSQCLDLYALCCSMLEATGKPHQAHVVMKKLVQIYPQNYQVHRLYSQYIAMFKPAQRRTALVKSLKVWLGRANFMLTREMPSSESVPLAPATTGVAHLIAAARMENSGHSSDENEDEPATDPLSNICDSGVYDRDISELQCALMLRELQYLSRQDLLSISCDTIEARPPRKKVICRRRQRPGSSAVVKEFDSGYTELHLMLWRNLASMLGPIPAYRSIDGPLSSEPGAEVLHSAPKLLSRALRSGVSNQTSSSSESGGRQSILPVDLPLEHFTSIPLKSIHTNNFNYLQLKKGSPGYGDEANLPKEISYLDDDDNEVKIIESSVENDDVGHSSTGGSSLSNNGSEPYSQDSCASLVEFLRNSRQYWCDGGYMFPTHCMGDSFSQTVLESTAKSVIDASLKLFEGVRETTIADKFFPSGRVQYGDGLCSILKNTYDKSDHQVYINAFVKKYDDVEHLQSVKRESEEDEREGLWEALEEFCAESGSYTIDGKRCQEEYGNDGFLSGFAVQKINGCISKSSQLWLDMDRKKSVFRRVPALDYSKHVFHRLGDKLLELLSYMAVVKAHLSSDEDGQFIARFAQVLIEQSEIDIIDSDRDTECPRPPTSDDGSALPTASQRCIAYLENMNINVLRQVRVANVLVANEVNPSVAPMVTCCLPDSEQLLVTSATLTGKKRVNRAYRPV